MIALVIRLHLFGEHYLNTANSYYNIGLVQSKKVDLEEALISLKKAKAIFSRELGVEHSKTVQTNATIDLGQQYTGLMQHRHSIVR